jgi:hypothetical protein
MVCLNENQVDEIRQLIEAKGAEMEELTNDLLDHICCMVEERMNHESDFRKVLQETMAVFGNNGIRNIQDETTFLLTKNLLAMKKTTHIIGITAAIFLLIGTFFKIYHLPGASVLYVSGGFLLSIIFLPLMLTIKIKEKISKPRIWMNVMGTISGILLVVSVLFKVMYWPGASIIMWIGGAMAMLGFLPLYIYTSIGNKEKRTTTITTAVISVGAMSMLFALVNLGSSHSVRTTISNVQYVIDENIDSIMNTNNALMNEIKSDSNSVITVVNKASLLAEQVNNLSSELIFSFTKSGFPKLNDEAIKSIIKSNKYEVYSKLGELNSLRNKENNLTELLKLVEDYKKTYEHTTGVSANLVVNKRNFDSYLNKENNQFSIRMVSSDINLLNLEVQRIHTSLLLAIKK